MTNTPLARVAIATRTANDGIHRVISRILRSLIEPDVWPCENNRSAGRFEWIQRHAMCILLPLQLALSIFWWEWAARIFVPLTNWTMHEISSEALLNVVHFGLFVWLFNVILAVLCGHCGPSLEAFSINFTLLFQPLFVIILSLWLSLLSLNGFWFFFFLFKLFAKLWGNSSPQNYLTCSFGGDEGGGGVGWMFI